MRSAVAAAFRDCGSTPRRVRRMSRHQLPSLSSSRGFSYAAPVNRLQQLTIEGLRHEAISQGYAETDDGFGERCDRKCPREFEASKSTCRRYKGRAPMSAYLTAERKLAAKFRQHVLALPPGARVEWRDMDEWAKANCGFSAWITVDKVMIPGPDWWDDLCVECMVVCERLELEGWLAFLYPGPCPGAPENYPRGFPDHYYRTHKALKSPE